MTYKKKISDFFPRVFDEVHRHIRRQDFDFYWLKGGRGSGKSSFVSLEIIQGIIRNPNCSAIIYKKVGETISDSVFSQMLWAVNTLGVAPWFRAKVSPYKLIYTPTGQEILFRGCDIPEKSKSIKPKNGYFGYCWFEELTDFSGIEEIENIVQSVARGSVNKTAVICTYNPPKSAQNWVNAEALKSVKNRFVNHSTFLDVPEKFLGSQFIRIAEETKKQNEKKYRHVYLGEVTGTGGEVFENIEIRRISDSEISFFDVLYCGLDFGFAVDPTAINKMYFKSSKKELFLFTEFNSVGASFDRISEYLKAIGNPVVTADSAEPRSIEELYQRGCRITGARKGAGSVEHGIKYLQNLNKIIIDPVRCPNTAREFLSYNYEMDKNGNFKSCYPDKNNHHIDAVRYALEKVFKGPAFSFD